MSKKILITGATGLIGKEALPFLIKDGFDVYAISTKTINDSSIHWLICDLFDENSVKKVFEKIKPEYLLNFAWITGGDYLTNKKNILFKNIGIKMLEFFKANGGKRAIYAGSGFEYDITDEILSETTPKSPKTLYAQCKNELHDAAIKFAQYDDISFGWGRIFGVFGHNEKNSRLTPQIMNYMKENRVFELGAPNNIMDYMYSKDIANAFVEFLKSDYCGDVNICSGHGISLKDYALLIQKLFKKENLIKYDDKKPSNLKYIGNNEILKESIGFSPKYTIEQALKEVIESYK